MLRRNIGHWLTSIKTLRKVITNNSQLSRIV
nr:MAG TPA: hypothetical protein [Caudoviricetes sp.]